MREIGASGIYMCMNCDTTQIGERNQDKLSLHLGPQGRVPTERDKRFQEVWNKRTEHDFDIKK